MSNLALLYPDYLRNTMYTLALSGGSWQSNFPLANLQSSLISKVARSADCQATHTTFDVDLGVQRNIGMLAIASHNVTAAGLMTVKLANVSNFSTVLHTSASLPMYPAGKSAEDVDGYNINWFYCPSSSVMARYARFSIVDTANPAGYVELGPLMIGGIFQPISSPEYGNLTLGWEANTNSTRSLGGVDWYNRQDPRRVKTFTLNLLSDAEAFDQVFEMQRKLGIDGMTFCTLDPSLTNFRRWQQSFVCTLRKLNALEYPQFDQNSAAFELGEIVGGAGSGRTSNINIIDSGSSAAYLPQTLSGGNVASPLYRFQWRRDTATNWTTSNPVLADGEPGLESDTGKEKVGNGTTTWTALPYRNSGASSLSQLSDWPSGLTATEISYMTNVTSDVQAQLNGKVAATLAALTSLVLAAAPRRIEGVWGDSTDGGTTPDSATQASINALLNAGVPAANIRWFYTPGAVSNNLVIAGVSSASAADNIALILAGGTLAIDGATSASLSDNVVITSASGGTLTISNATSASTSDNVVIILAGGTFAIDNAASASTADNVVMTSAGGGTLAINNAVSASTADNVVMSQPSALALDKAFGPTPVAFTASSSGTTLTVTAVSSGTLQIDMVVTANNVNTSARITALGTGTGGTGTYTISSSPVWSSQTFSGGMGFLGASYGGESFLTNVSTSGNDIILLHIVRSALSAVSPQNPGTITTTGSLTWTKVASGYQSNSGGDFGYTEVWKAVGTLSSATIGYTPSSSNAGVGAMFITAFSGSASNATGATVSDCWNYENGAGTGPFTDSITPQASGSFIVGVFSNFTNASTPAFGTGQALISMASGNNFVSDHSGDSYFIAMTSSALPNTSAVTFGATSAGGVTALVGDWSFVEVKK